jgi:hypothetical protein
MIDKKINNLKDRLANIHMSADDKREVFKRISLVVDKIEAVSSEFHKAPVLSPFSSDNSVSGGRFASRFASNIFVYVRQRKFVPSLVVVLLLCATGGVSAFADNAMPGDYLYLLKVNVNEQVKGFVAVTPEAKARLAVETTERRLQEAVILSSQGKLTDERKQIIQGQLSKNATDVKNSVADLVASNNISVAQEVAINFEASLKTHELMLETLTKSAENAKNGTSTSGTVIVSASSTSAAASSTASSTEAGVTTFTTIASSTNSTSTTQVGTAQAVAITALQPISTLMQDIRSEINSNTKVREELSIKEIAAATDPAVISDKIKTVRAKYSDLAYQRKTLTDLSPASIKLFDTYLNTASSTLNDAENALQNKDLVKSMTALQQAVKSLSDSDSLLSIELNSKPEVRKMLELIDINKLLNSIHSDDSNSPANSTSTVLNLNNSTSTEGTLSTKVVSSI